MCQYYSIDRGRFANSVVLEHDGVRCCVYGKGPKVFACSLESAGQSERDLVNAGGLSRKISSPTRIVTTFRRFCSKLYLYLSFPVRRFWPALTIIERMRAWSLLFTMLGDCVIVVFSVTHVRKTVVGFGMCRDSTRSKGFNSVVSVV